MKNSLVKLRSRNGVNRIVVGAVVVSLASLGGFTAAGAGSLKPGTIAYAKSVYQSYMKTPTTIAVTTPLPKPVPKNKNMIFLVQNSVPSVVLTGQGVMAAAAAVGWQHSEISYDPSSPASLGAAFAAALLKHPTFVSVEGAPSDVFGASTLAAYQKAGVPIITTSVTTNNLTKDCSPTAKFCILGDPGSNAVYGHMGDALAAWFAVNSNMKGQALVVHVNDFPILDYWATHFTSQVAKDCPKCELKQLSMNLSEVQAGQEPGAVVSALRADPNLKYVFFDDGVFSTGVDSALASAGLTNVKVAGSDMQPTDATALRTHVETAWTATNDVIKGYAIVDIALRHLEGQVIPAGDSMAPPVQLFTAATIGNTTAMTNPSTALQQYEKLWHVKKTSNAG